MVHHWINGFNGSSSNLETSNMKAAHFFEKSGKT
jgi:hypothetical protein